MLGKIQRPANKQVSNLQNQRMHLKSVNNTRISSISPARGREESFDFIKTTNIPFSPQNSIQGNPRRNKIDVKIRFVNNRLKSADEFTDGKLLRWTNKFGLL